MEVSLRPKKYWSRALIGMSYRAAGRGDGASRCKEENREYKILKNELCTPRVDFQKTILMEHPA